MAAQNTDGTIDTTRLTIDGREVEVPAGTGLVEAAAAAGIEIPIFCYEPRIGPAVGACRMCMVEIEGMPKLQTACSTAVRDGMVVNSNSGRARDAQEGVLEFLLINHPLDCPVCDKGGECPLQDHTFRWGPGASRFLEKKRTNDKPIPISPLIALDRERCILCYRCTRFSSEVSQEHQLISRQRGPSTVIATFDGRPYKGHFSGNIIELCPVGALTSTEYRFKGRPWEVTDHPTVCGLCPVGCNVYSSSREGEVARVIARTNPDVDNGWLCDRGRFSYSALQAPARITAPAIRNRGERATSSMEGALEWLYQRLTLGNQVTWVLSGHETCEEVYAIQQIAAQTSGRVIAAENAAAATPERQATLADLPQAEEILILGDSEIVEVAPIVDLRVREAMRKGARVTVAGIGGSAYEREGASYVPLLPGTASDFLRTVAADRSADGLGKRLSAAARTVVIFTDGDLSQEAQQAAVEAFGLGTEGSGLLGLPVAPNARGLAALGVEPAGAEGMVHASQAVIFVNLDPTRVWDEQLWGTQLNRASWVASVGMFENGLTDRADLVMPATSPFEKEGTLVNLEGRLQRLTVGGTPPETTRTELSWLTGLARRLGARLPAHAAGVFRVMAADAELAGRFPAAAYADIGLQGVLGVAGGATARTRPAPNPGTTGQELSLFIGPSLYDAPDVDHSPSMHFLREQAELTVSRDDAAALSLEHGGRADVAVGDHVITARVVLSPRIARGHARMVAGAPGVPTRLRGYWSAAVEPIWRTEQQERVH